jgi:ArsR family transcriptional regulator
MRALSAPSRVRLLALLNESELTVRELTEITGMRQSGISMHLGQMQEAGLVESSRDGKNAYYRVARDSGAETGLLIELAAAGVAEILEHASDLVNLKRILERRENQDLVYFNRVAGRFDSVYGPGRSWQAFGQLLLRLVPEIVVADLGSGEGLLSELLARKCKRVIAVDNSEKIVKFGQAKAERNGLANLEFRQGDLQHPPIDDVSVDLAILSQALHHAEEPAQAVAGAFRILKPGGQLMILDLVAHKFGRARELFGDRWLGFAESELHQWIESAGFGRIDISVVSREEEEPHFETLLASATRPA